MWLAPLDISPLPRVPTMYREQYCSVQRNEPPRSTRFACPGSCGSWLVSGPCGFLTGWPGLRASRA